MRMDAGFVRLDRQRVGDALSLVVMAGREKVPLSRKLDELPSVESFVKAMFHDLTSSVDVKWPETRIADHGKR